MCAGLHWQRPTFGSRAFLLSPMWMLSHTLTLTPSRTSWHVRWDLALNMHKICYACVSTCHVCLFHLLAILPLVYKAAQAGDCIHLHSCPQLLFLRPSCRSNVLTMTVDMPAAYIPCAMGEEHEHPSGQRPGAEL